MGEPIIISPSPPSSNTSSGGGGTNSDLTFVYTQTVPSDTWIITHNLNKYPSITVVDSANSVVVGDCQYIDTNSLKLTFNGGFSGNAYLN